MCLPFVGGFMSVPFFRSFLLRWGRFIKGSLLSSWSLQWLPPPPPLLFLFLTELLLTQQILNLLSLIFFSKYRWLLNPLVSGVLFMKPFPILFRLLFPFFWHCLLKEVPFHPWENALKYRVSTQWLLHLVFNVLSSLLSFIPYLLYHL